MSEEAADVIICEPLRTPIGRSGGGQGLAAAFERIRA